MSLLIKEEGWLRCSLSDLAWQAMMVFGMRESSTLLVF